MERYLLRSCNESNYFLCFDRENGKFLRQGFNDEDPFWNVYGPELLDISITNYCEKGCSFCYRASNKSGIHVKLEDYRFIIQQAEKIGVLQVALGGGNPNQHPDFINILEITRNHRIIPSYTTNGQGMTDDIYIATKKHCGAMAVSWYPPYYIAENVIDKCNEYGIKVNLHFMLNRDTIADAIDLLDNGKDILQKINATVFLNYKPIHSSNKLILSETDNLNLFFQKVNQIKECKIGFDSCMISYLALIFDDIHAETTEYCEAARFSAFISENLLLYPCSFYNDTNMKGIDLTDKTLQYGWQYGEEFINLRSRLSKPGEQKHPINKCKLCEKYSFCHGGCQVFDINNCRRYK